MHKRISDEEKRLRSINAYVVLFVFFIMVAAGIICVMIYNVLSAFGLMKHIEVVPMLMPLIMLCSCVIIGSILSAMPVRHTSPSAKRSQGGSAQGF